MTQEKKWALDYDRGESGTKTELMTDRELDRASDRIAEQRANGQHIELRLATEEEKERAREQEAQQERDRGEQQREQQGRQLKEKEQQQAKEQRELFDQFEARTQRERAEERERREKQDTAERKEPAEREEPKTGGAVRIKEHYYGYEFAQEPNGKTNEAHWRYRDVPEQDRSRPEIAQSSERQPDSPEQSREAPVPKETRGPDMEMER